MDQTTYERCHDEFEALESQLSPWDDEPHRAAFVEAFGSFLASLDLIWSDWLDAIEARLDQKAVLTT